jgi:hypothetical protein
MLRSHQTSPTQWLAYIDRDEDFFPKVEALSLPETSRWKQLQSLLPAYFDNLLEDIGSVCFRKSYHSTLVNLAGYVPDDVAQSAPIELSRFGRFVPPGENNLKCVHRVTGCEMANVQ